MLSAKHNPAFCAKHLISPLCQLSHTGNSTRYPYKLSRCRGQTPILLSRAKLESSRSVHADVLEPVRPAIFPVQPRLALGEATGDTALTLGRVRAVEEWNMLVANVTEPVGSVSHRCLL